MDLIGTRNNAGSQIRAASEGGVPPRSETGCGSLGIVCQVPFLSGSPEAGLVRKGRRRQD